MGMPGSGYGRALKSLALIRAKHLAESVTTPMLLTDREGTLIFYNEAAEVLLGYSFSDLGALPAKEWQEQFNVRGRDGTPFPLEAMPGWLEVQGERPGTGHVLLTRVDGVDLFLAVCAFPLFTAQRQFDGALVLFWHEEES
jgi:PAS domain-containing protein